VESDVTTESIQIGGIYFDTTRDGCEMVTGERADCGVGLRRNLLHSYYSGLAEPRLLYGDKSVKSNLALAEHLLPAI
jgi:hypothetical protein